MLTVSWDSLVFLVFSFSLRLMQTTLYVQQSICFSFTITLSSRLKGASERFNLLLPLPCNLPRVCQTPSQHEWGAGEGGGKWGGFTSDEVSSTPSCSG